MSESADEDIRVDVWLWRARFFKTRGLASEYVTKKGVRITRHGATRKTVKAGQRIGPGDVLTFYKAKAIETVEVVELGTRRGPASEAVGLYRRVTPGA
ncbi:MAG: RNA-binding S4 domain-containing protein [Pseudomonadota bacterium]